MGGCTGGGGGAGEGVTFFTTDSLGGGVSGL